RARLSGSGARARLLSRRRAVRVRLGDRRGGAGGIPGAGAAGGDHARAGVGARGGPRHAPGQAAFVGPSDRGRALGARRQGRAGRGEGRGGRGGMSRLDETFKRLRARGERALVVYFTAGDPSMETTARLVIEAERRGADVIELGVPFSDPVADGPVNQRAGQ